jgi:hypothetical protein
LSQTPIVDYLINSEAAEWKKINNETGNIAKKIDGKIYFPLEMFKWHIAKSVILINKLNDQVLELKKEIIENMELQNEINKIKFDDDTKT